MLTYDQLNLIIPIISSSIIAILILFIGRHLQVFDRTSRNSVIARYSIENIQEDLNDLKTQMREMRERVDKSHDDITMLMEKKNEKLRDDFQKLAQKVDDVNIRSQLNTSRMDSVERKLDRNGIRGH